MKEPILSREQYETAEREYGYDRDTDIARRGFADGWEAAVALLEKLCGEPVAYTTQANFEMMKKHNTGVMYRDVLDGDIPLYALNRSKA